MKKIAFTLLIMCLSKIAYTQDLITFKNGNIEKVTIKEVSETEIKYQKIGMTVLYTVKKSSLFSAQYQNGTKEPLNEYVIAPSSSTETVEVPKTTVTPIQEVNKSQNPIIVKKPPVEIQVTTSSSEKNRIIQKKERDYSTAKYRGFFEIFQMISPEKTLNFTNQYKEFQSNTNLTTSHGIMLNDAVFIGGTVGAKVSGSMKFFPLGLDIRAYFGKNDTRFWVGAKGLKVFTNDSEYIREYSPSSRNYYFDTRYADNTTYHVSAGVEFRLSNSNKLHFSVGYYPQEILTKREDGTAASTGRIDMIPIMLGISF